MKITEYRAQAERNSTKAAGELRVGDFVYAFTGLGKEVDFADFVHSRTKYCTGGRTLCRIVDVVEVPEDHDLLTDWLTRPAPANRGGSRSDDAPDDMELWKITDEVRDTFYTLCTMYRKPSGQWIAVDCQGHDYWRYVYLPTNWLQMYTGEYAEAIAAINAEDARQEAEHAAELVAHAAALDARMNELRAIYPELRENPDNARTVAANVRKFFKKHFPELPVKVSVRATYYGDGWRVSAEAPKDTPQGVRDEVSEVCKTWEATLPSGHEAEGYYYDGLQETHICPMAELFGRIECGIRIGYWR